MMRKAALLVGLAAGYVLGARDGRERYEQIRSTATKFAQDPRVQAKATQAADVARAKAPGVTDKVAEKVASTVGSSGSSGSSGHDVDPGPTTLDALDSDVVVVPTGPVSVDGGHHV